MWHRRTVPNSAPGGVVRRALPHARRNRAAGESCARTASAQPPLRRAGPTTRAVEGGLPPSPRWPCCRDSRAGNPHRVVVAPGGQVGELVRVRGGEVGRGRGQAIQRGPQRRQLGDRRQHLRARTNTRPPPTAALWPRRGVQTGSPEQAHARSPQWCRRRVHAGVAPRSPRVTRPHHRRARPPPHQTPAALNASVPRPPPAPAPPAHSPAAPPPRAPEPSW